MQLVVGLIGSVKGDKMQYNQKKKWLRTAVKSFIMERFAETMFNDVVFAVKDDRLWYLAYTAGLPTINDKQLFNRAEVLVDIDKGTIVLR